MAHERSHDAQAGFLMEDALEPFVRKPPRAVVTARLTIGHRDTPMYGREPPQPAVARGQTAAPSPTGKTPPGLEPGQASRPQRPGRKARPRTSPLAKAGMKRTRRG